MLFCYNFFHKFENEEHWIAPYLFLGSSVYLAEGPENSESLYIKIVRFLVVLIVIWRDACDAVLESFATTAIAVKFWSSVIKMIKFWFVLIHEGMPMMQCWHEMDTTTMATGYASSFQEGPKASRAAGQGGRHQEDRHIALLYLVCREGGFSRFHDVPCKRFVKHIFLLPVDCFKIISTFCEQICPSCFLNTSTPN